MCLLELENKIKKKEQQHLFAARQPTAYWPSAGKELSCLFSALSFFLPLRLNLRYSYFMTSKLYVFLSHLDVEFDCVGLVIYYESE